MTAVGVLLFAASLFFAGEDSGLMIRPASSFRLANANWVTYGLVIAMAGAAMNVTP